MPPVERCRKEEKFTCKIQKDMENIEISLGIDSVYINCPKSQLIDVLAKIEQYIIKNEYYT